MNWIETPDGVKQVDILEWGKWFETADRVVAQDEVGGHVVSTVFLGIDHNFGAGPPLLYETMVFPKDAWAEQDCERYATRAEAQAGHVAMVTKWASR